MEAVAYNAQNKVLVDAFEELPEDRQLGAYWGDAAVNAVRAEIKNHYIEEQQYRCVYCKSLVPTDNNMVWDAEHVISRALAPRFMFEPRNLAVSCKDCNLAKGEKEVRVNPKRKSFPDESQHYTIVHPHFDEYDDHIRWFGNICAPHGSEKGTNTIVMCNLMRFAGKILGIDGAIVNPGFDALIGQLITAKTDVEMLAVIAGLKVYAEKIPQK